MTVSTFPQTFRRQLRYWAFHSSMNALPSLIIALGWLGLWKHPEAIGAIFAAIASFILIYATLTSLKGPVSDGGHVIHRAVRLGAKIRAWISGISIGLVILPAIAMFTPDFWCGWAAINLLNLLERVLGSGGDFFTIDPGSGTHAFWKVYVTTMLEGFILSLLLMFISFFCVIFIQSRDRRRAYGALDQPGGLQG